MNELMIYKHKQFGEIRILTIDGEPWFVGKDVAERLGYSRPNDSIADHVDNEDKMNLNKETQRQNNVEFNYKLLGQRGGWIINESGMYSLILSSQLPSAKQFKRWVTSEVLPSIRKTGSYGLPQLTEKQQLQLSILNGGEVERIGALAKYEELVVKEVTQPLLNKIEEDKPLVTFAEAISNCSDSIDIGIFAKVIKDEGIKLGRNKLFDWLRNNKYLMKNNQPYQKYIDNKYFEIIEYAAKTPYGEKICTKTLIKGLGQIKLIEKLRKEISNT